jgi:hypothetical protein
VLRSDEAVTACCRLRSAAAEAVMRRAAAPGGGGGRGRGRAWAAARGGKSSSSGLGPRVHGLVDTVVWRVDLVFRAW